MSYYLVVTQKGCGCDYMIGCGMKYEQIDTDDLDEAIEIAREEHYCDCYLDGEREASEMLLLRVVDEIDLASKLRHPDMEPEEAELLEEYKDRITELKGELRIKTVRLDDIEEKLVEMFGVKDVSAGRTVLDNLMTKAVHDEARKIVKQKLEAKQKLAVDALKEAARDKQMEVYELNQLNPLVKALNLIAKGG